MRMPPVLKKLRDPVFAPDEPFGTLRGTLERNSGVIEEHVPVRPSHALIRGVLRTGIGMEAVMSGNLILKTSLDVQIRWLIRRDMPEVLEIEQDSFEFAWTEEDFLCCLRQRNCIGMVAEHNHRIVGFMIYELHRDKLQILNFAVAKSYRRRTVGKQMVLRLVDRLSQQRRKEICLEVRERNLPAQQFFKSQEFRAVDVLRGHYEDTAEDAYLMRYSLDAEDAFVPRNRIAEFDAESDADAA